MAKTNQAPRSVRVANVLITTLLRAGLPLVGPGLVIGNYPLYLLTVRGRKSGKIRTVPLVILERNGKRYVGSPYGIVAWVRNLRAAGEATLLLREDIKGGNPFARYFGVTADSSLEEFERAAVSHPVFVLESK